MNTRPELGAMRKLEDRAHYLNEPTSADPILKILAGIPSLDVDAGPNKASIRAYGSGMVWSRKMTNELDVAVIRLRAAGYEVKESGGRTSAVRLLVTYR